MKIIIKTLLILIFTASIGACNPMKVTDPADPRFDPDKFSFNDYDSSREEKIGAFKKLFPIGTSKEFIVRVLVKAGGANCLPIKEFPQVWHCAEPRQYRLPAGPSHILVFDKNNNLENLEAFTTVVLYPSQTTYKQIRQQKYPEEK